jgi:NTP pyrophosphatase (non-canonical NTP hydrolase)
VTVTDPRETLVQFAANLRRDVTKGALHPEVPAEVALNLAAACDSAVGAIDDFGLDAFQAANAARGRRWHHGDLGQWSLLEWCGAMAGEAGEACNVAKKLRRLDLELPNKEAGLTVNDSEQLKEKLANEVGDTLIYGLLILSCLGVTASDVIARVFDRKSVEYGFPERARQRRS